MVTEQHCIAFASLLVDRDGKVVKQCDHVGLDSADRFLDHLLETEKEVLDILSKVKPMKLTAKDREVMATAEKCHICEKPFTEETGPPVADHDHYNAK